MLSRKIDGLSGGSLGGFGRSPRDASNGAEGDRTPNLCIANTALSQLSYGPDYGLSIVSKPEGSVKSAGHEFNLKKFWTYPYTLVYTRLAEQQLGANHPYASTM